MKRAAVTTVVLGILLAAFWLPPLGARQYDAGARFEYLRLVPKSPRAFGATIDTAKYTYVYEACAAGQERWECRQFEAPHDEDEALRRAITTLGAERWELASVIAPQPNVFPPGLTYLFKRQLR